MSTKPESENHGWVHRALEPDQLSSAKRKLPPKKISKPILVVLWTMRVYVVAMSVLIVIDVWNAIHASVK